MNTHGLQTCSSLQCFGCGVCALCVCVHVYVCVLASCPRLMLIKCDHISPKEEEMDTCQYTKLPSLHFFPLIMLTLFFLKGIFTSPSVYPPLFTLFFWPIPSSFGKQHTKGHGTCVRSVLIVLQFLEQLSDFLENYPGWIKLSCNVSCREDEIKISSIKLSEAQSPGKHQHFAKTSK